MRRRTTMKQRSAIYKASNGNKPFEILWHRAAWIPSYLYKEHITITEIRTWNQHGTISYMEKSTKNNKGGQNGTTKK